MPFLLEEESNPAQQRIAKMLECWTTEARAFSHLDNNDDDFFTAIGQTAFETGITSQTGTDLIYYDTRVYSSDANAIRKLNDIEVY